MSHVNEPLDNPAWSCLTTRHAHLADGDDRARRYPPDISPIAGIKDPGSESVAALEALFAVGDVVAITGAFVPKLSSRWELLLQSHLIQMVQPERRLLPEGDAPIVALSTIDAEEMLALVELTHPGPFRMRTVELGRYVGIREQGRLVAMAGERMWIGEHREVSAVCTHPDVQGRGHARAVMAHVINGMIRAGQTPMLHVESVNARAIAIYRKLGFEARAEFPLLFAKRDRS